MVSTLARNPTFGPDQPLNPYVSDIHLDANGVRWVVVTRPVENWRDFVVEFAPGHTRSNNLYIATSRTGS